MTTDVLAGPPSETPPEPSSDSLPTATAAPGHTAELRARGVYPALDGLRIVAVTAVMGTHSGFWTGHYARGSGSGIWSHLDIGVAVFFVISGFLISREWLTVDRRSGGMPRFGAYAARRLRRIMPAYWVALVAVIVFDRFNHGLGVETIVRNVLLLQTYGSGHLLDGFTQTWSLCAEAAFYALLPVAAWLIVRVARRRERIPAVTGAAVALALVAGSAWVVWYHDDRSAWLGSAGYWLPTSLSFFAAGVWLTGVRLGADRGGRVWRSLDRLGDSPGVCVLVSLCAFALVITPVSGSVLDPTPSGAQALTRNLLYMVAALALVAPAVLGTGGSYDAVLGHPVMRYLGRISYSIFLFHLMVLEGIQHVLGHPLFTGDVAVTFVLTWLVTLPIAALTYQLVERPALRLGRRAPRTAS